MYNFKHNNKLLNGKKIVNLAKFYGYYWDRIKFIVRTTNILL